MICNIGDCPIADKCKKTIKEEEVNNPPFWFSGTNNNAVCCEYFKRNYIPLQ